MVAGRAAFLGADFLVTAFLAAAVGRAAFLTALFAVDFFAVVEGFDAFVAAGFDAFGFAVVFFSLIVLFLSLSRFLCLYDIDKFMSTSFE